MHRQFPAIKQTDVMESDHRSKFVNELVFFAFWILPVYEVSGLADLLVLNSIEFWSGKIL